MTHKIVKNAIKGYTIELYFTIENEIIVYVVYVDTKKQATKWLLDNKKNIEKIRNGLSGF